MQETISNQSSLSESRRCCGCCCDKKSQLLFDESNLKDGRKLSELSSPEC